MWAILIIGLLVSMGFVNKEQDSLTCKSLDVNVNQDYDLDFLNKDDIAKLIHDRGDSIVGQPKSSINVAELETALNSHADIANAEVYMTIDGQVKVEVKQRRPIIRVINADGDSYYIDDEGKLMPLSDKYTARVIIANGYILEPYARRYQYSINDIGKDSMAKENSLLDELYAMSNYINADEFWKAQIKQIYINVDREMEIVPLVGNQKIIFGDTTAMDEKFKKLMTFYQQGLNITGWWDKYSSINLKFKNQIVCTKKEIIKPKALTVTPPPSPIKAEKVAAKKVEKVAVKKNKI
jgi:cell division protein FtsQ